VSEHRACGVDLPIKWPFFVGKMIVTSHQPAELCRGVSPKCSNSNAGERERERELNTRDEFHQMFEAVAGELVGIWNLFKYVCV
jgi:hypothetical protein